MGEGWALAFKVESHNHPSAVEPYEGAATGWAASSGTFPRDGRAARGPARPLRFGPMNQERNRYLFREVVRGIGGYGNAVGVPTVGGGGRRPPPTPATRSSTRCVGLIRTEDLVRSQATGVGTSSSS